MTEVGHCITAAAIGLLALPRYPAGGGVAAHAPVPLRAMAARVCAFVLLAEVPDLPLPAWGHDRYDISHSVFVSVLGIGIAAAVLCIVPGARAKVGRWPIVAAGAAAWLSHLLLDTFYNHGHGLAMLWPFSPARLALPFPWFSTIDVTISPFAASNTRIRLIELACYGPLLLLAVVIRRWSRSRQQPT